MVVARDCIRILDLSLLSFGLVDRHTSQRQAAMGTPELVPVPKKVICKGGYGKMFRLVVTGSI